MKLLGKIFNRSELSVLRSSRLRASHGAAGIEYATLLAIVCIAIIPAISNFTEKSSFKLAGAFQADPESAAFRAGPFDPVYESSIFGDADSIQEHSYLVAQNNGGGTLDGTPTPTTPHSNTLFTATADDSGEGASDGSGQDSSVSGDSLRTSTSPLTTVPPASPTGEVVRR